MLTEHVLRGGSGGKQGRIELLAERDAAAERLTEVTTAGRALRARRSPSNAALHSTRRRRIAAGRCRAARARRAARRARRSSSAASRVQLEAAEAECERLAAARRSPPRRCARREADVEQRRAPTHAEYVREPRPILDVSARDGLLAELEAARAAEVDARIQLETAARAGARRGGARAGTRRASARPSAPPRRSRRAVDACASGRCDAGDNASSTRCPPCSTRSTARSPRRAWSWPPPRPSAPSRTRSSPTLRASETALRERLHAVSENVHGLEMQIYEKKLHLSTLLERAGDELGLVEDVLVAEYGPQVPVPAMTPTRSGGRGARELASRASREPTRADSDGLDKLGQRTASRSTAPSRRPASRKAERKYQQLGRVNPLALEEFAALEQRHKFLTEQLTDLTKTRKDLLTIIEEIDEKMQDIFAAAFADTQAAFDEVFPILFPGGTGSLHLTNPDDLLTTGIEVSVKPAGKKIERLSLLSGGERSLAAVALLIAIFKARPSPFYIMDEVEAALDDANLGRLLTIFEDLRQTSQLIVITHQKRTMEIADALYGVSMRQDGVSAVVGQRVAQPEERASWRLPSDAPSVSRAYQRSCRSR